ncbi:MAG: hypothetical protein WCF04_09865 [Candidatus Nanopelagicales bacterium]
MPLREVKPSQVIDVLVAMDRAGLGPSPQGHAHMRCGRYTGWLPPATRAPRALVAVLAYTGMRIGEALALRWTDWAQPPAGPAAWRSW